MAFSTFQGFKPLKGGHGFFRMEDLNILFLGFFINNVFP